MTVTDPAKIRELAEGFLEGEFEALSTLDKPVAYEHLAQNGIDVDDDEVISTFESAYRDAHDRARNRLMLP